ncbi:MAG TPA: hypothetical protein VFP89_10250 [Propionibacteriaceae bacterium]|nr:hypothetical protein [Propionibacteriaceae bacterium]
MTEPASKWENLAFDSTGRLVDLGGPLEFVDFGPPPAVSWVPAMDFGEVFGRRAAVVFASGPVYDLRLASDVFEDAGGWYVHVVGEHQWWEWASVRHEERPRRPPRAVCWPARYVWVEQRGTWSLPR